MTTPADKPDDASAVEPGAIDLDALRAHYQLASGVPHSEFLALIAAVEALRARVETARLEVEQCHAKSTCCCGDYMKQHTGYDGHSPVAMYDYALDGAVTRAEAAEARVAELTGALMQSIEDCSVCDGTGKRFMSWRKEHEPEITEEECPRCKPWRTVLAAMPAQALERANLGKALITASDAVIDTGPRIRSDPVSHEFALAKLCDVMGQIAEIDAAGKEEE